jgi:hypothetical protein
MSRKCNTKICVRCASCSPRIMQMMRAPAARNKGCYFWTPCMFMHAFHERYMYVFSDRFQNLSHDRFCYSALQHQRRNTVEMVKYTGRGYSRKQIHVTSILTRTLCRHRHKQRIHVHYAGIALDRVPRVKLGGRRDGAGGVVDSLFDLLHRDDFRIPGSVSHCMACLMPRADMR